MEKMESDVPGKVREGGREGYESKRIERHIAAHFHEFIKQITLKTFNIFKNNDFDWLFVGCRDEYCQEFSGLLHPYLKDRMKAKLKINPSDAPDKILKQVLKLKKKLKEEEQKNMMDRFVSEIEKGGLAVSGLKNTLRSLNRSEVDTLLVTRYFTMPGKMCSKCQLLFADETKCPVCGQKTRSLIDVMDEAVEAALDKKCRVMHIEAPSNLRKYGNVGALLRFKTKT
jgi:peptide subunit release factor 1 (eRF1)